MLIVDRLISLLGLDFDLQIDWQDEAFHRITDTLHLGARPGPEDVEGLKEAGITHVVSCLPENRRELIGFLETDFETRFFPLRDSIHQDITPSVPRFLDAVSRVQDRGGQFLVHCEAGVSRSATLAVAFVMHAEAQGFYDAFHRVRSRRPAVLPNIGFASQLQRLEHRLRPAGDPGDLSSLTRYLVEACDVPVEPELLERALQRHDFDAFAAILSLFDGEMPRVVHGVRI